MAITDQLIPGATLLGYADLDHWDIALPVRERLNIGGVNSRADAPDAYVGCGASRSSNHKEYE